MPAKLIMQRSLACLAAAALVGAVAIAANGPAQLTLGQAIFAMNADALPHLHAHVVHMLGDGAWQWLFVPSLVRPIWLLPVCFGLLFAGGAMSLEQTPAPHTKQRRS